MIYDNPLQILLFFVKNGNAKPRYNLSTMKKLLVLFLIISFISSAAFSPPSKETARADATSFTYARVVVPDAAFYADRSLSLPRFFLPESYFVRVISEDLDVCRVAYMDGTSRPVKEGYVKTVCLSFVYEVPAVIYPDVTLSVKTEDVLFSARRTFGFFLRRLLRGNAFRRRNVRLRLRLGLRRLCP